MRNFALALLLIFCVFLLIHFAGLSLFPGSITTITSEGIKFETTSLIEEVIISFFVGLGLFYVIKRRGE